MRKLMMTAFAACLLATPAFAQDKPVEVNFGFGWTFPTMDFKESFDPGWHGTVGVAFFGGSKVGFLVDYTYNKMGGPERFINVVSNPIVGAPTTSELIEANHQVHATTFNAIWRSATDSAINGYLLGGGGWYHRVVQITTPAVGYTTFCDPYWYVCYPSLVAVDQVIGDRSSNDFGINIGGGITFGREARFYIESRYHYVWGPEIAPAVPSQGGETPSVTTNAAYFPLTFGIRF
jgi:opacity protein-like surface antigen